MRLGPVQGSAGAYLTAELRKATPGVLLLVEPSVERAERAAGDLAAFLLGGDFERVELFPPHDTSPYDRFSPQLDVESRRMNLLYQLLAAEPGSSLLVVAPWAALLRRVLPRSELRARVTHLERGQTLDRDALIEVLVAAGYHHTTLVEERGEVAMRGGIVDLFPPQLEGPIRLEFEFEAIGSIRRFDTQTQRSLEELRHVVAIPPRSLRLPSDRDDLLREARNLGRAQGLPESQIYEVVEPLSRRSLPPGIEALEALFHETTETLFDYLPDDAIVLVDDPESGRRQADAFTEEVFQGHARARARDRMVSDPLELFITADTAFDRIDARRPVLFDALGTLEAGADEDAIGVHATDHRDLRREIKESRGSGRALEPLRERLDRWKSQDRRVRIATPALSAAERLADILRDYGHELPISSSSARAPFAELPQPGGADIAVARIDAGFELGSDGLVFLCEADLFGARLRARPTPKLRRSQSLERLAQIQEGDFLVHAEHGIGRYRGLARLDVGKVSQEFLLLEFAKGDKLYLPVSRLERVQRYAGADARSPMLDRLGGQSFARTKKKVKRALVEMAEELLAVIAARQVLEGHAYPAPDAAYEEFEAGFPYEDTPDQRSATDDVLQDLQKARPMDRLVCGDVGFGKTEVAARAAFQVTSSGRQVAFLVPTTVLCQQHEDTLRERFADTPVQIASLSRYSPPKELREVREGLQSGRIDVIVGTHRLLSKDVAFRNLGLLVVDEEHRFGVAHKERIKSMRKLVDVMTLTATPIPRTLHMAMSGLRDLSIITTPPPDRVAIRTEVCRFSEELVADVVQRELRRGGQVFVVHNRVETIDEFTGLISRVVPGARIRAAHGQMRAQQLEKIMLGFVHHEFDVLVSTAIIESGLDIPNANTILIHRADRFGLAQLYQLRGRVGRSDRRAYCYLFLPPQGVMTDDARRRIEAIQDLSELGAGFRLASEDLEIRGAGNLLGGEQSGHIASVGYDLYVEMLEQAMEELRGGRRDDVPEPEIRVPLATLLPESYVEETSQRLVFYKQLSSARNEQEIAEVRDDLLDRYGPLPIEAEQLMDVIRLKLQCRDLGVLTVDVVAGELVIALLEGARIDAQGLARLLHRPGSPLRVTPDHRIYMKLRQPEDALAEARQLLELLTDKARAGEAAAAGAG